MEKKYSSGQLPVTTSNVSLAFALYLAGAPFADNDAPLANLYDAEMLGKMGFSGEIEAAVARAFAAGRKGHVEYAFARTEEFSEAYGAYDKQQKATGLYHDDSKAVVGEIMEKLNGGRLTLAEAISASVCVLLKRWRAELNDWERHRDFTSQRNKHVTANYDAREQAEKLFLGGNFYKFAALFIDAREAFLKLHTKYPPQIRFRHRGGTVPTGKDRTKYPGFSILITGSVPDNDVRKHLKIPTR